VLGSDRLQAFLDGKFDNPMLGMLACYAVLKQPEVDYWRLQYIAGNLLSLIPHSPDAQLIKLLAELGRSSPSTATPDNWPRFTAPPMLAVGTELLMRQTSSIADLCPADSWLANIAIRLTTGSAWTRWETDVSASEAFQRLVEALRSRLSKLQNHWTIARNILAEPTGLRAAGSAAGSPVERIVVDALSREFRLPWSVIDVALIAAHVEGSVQRENLQFGGTNNQV
jgi:hypothetical protein